MTFMYEPNRIFHNDTNGCTLAEVTFPAVNENTVNINHTFVDDSLRGQGVASQLLEAAAAQIARDGKQVIPTCSYAVKWFEKHPEYQNILAKPE